MISELAFERAGVNPVSQAPARTIRVLHIVENLDDQAVESWLLRVLRESRKDYTHIKWTFFCVVGQKGRLDDVARDLGAEVLHSQYEIGDKVRFLRSLRRVMKEGNFDILHCHHDIMSAAYLLAAKGLPFLKRIVHVHNTSLSLPTQSRFKAGVVRGPMRQICLSMADQIVGISQEALSSLCGNQSTNLQKQRIVHYAVETERFKKEPARHDLVREELSLPAESRLLLFVGRLVAYKNPTFVLQVLEHVIKVDPNVFAVFAGRGDQEQMLLALAQKQGLADRVRLLGFREDVARLMLASDVLLWPSLESPQEGLGLGVVEAQAAGLPVLMSRSVPAEAIVVASLVQTIPLAAGPEVWAEAVGAILERPNCNRAAARAAVELSSFSMAAGVRNLMALYES